MQIYAVLHLTKMFISVFEIINDRLNVLITISCCVFQCCKDL